MRWFVFCEEVPQLNFQTGAFSFSQFFRTFLPKTFRDHQGWLISGGNNNLGTTQLLTGVNQVTT
jgi:hypothetical protein